MLESKQYHGSHIQRNKNKRQCSLDPALVIYSKLLIDQRRIFLNVISACSKFSDFFPRSKIVETLSMSRCSVDGRTYERPPKTHGNKRPDLGAPLFSHIIN